MLATVSHERMNFDYVRPAETSGRWHVLVVDEDDAVRSACCEIAAGKGFVAHAVAAGEAARKLLQGNTVDVLLIDGRPRENRAILEEMKLLRPQTSVVVMTVDASIHSAVEAMRTGAADYLTKPFSIDALTAVLERAVEHRSVDMASRRLRERLRTQQGLGDIIGNSPEMEKLYRILSKVSQTSHPVLILGESGTGKELVARSIHAYGPNASRPFLPVDCGSLVPTLIESELFGYVKGAFTGANRSKQGLLAAAEGGTVFLDEIGELPLDLQAKLLRALQEKEIRPVGSTQRVPIHLRVLAATNRDLVQMVEQGRFRKDLYYHLNVVSLKIPPLRERREDIPRLAAHFLQRINQDKERPLVFSDEALRVMMDYPWPGNVRELENCIDKVGALCSGPWIQLSDLTVISDFESHARQAKRAVIQNDGEGRGDQVTTLAELERRAIFEALQKLKGDKLAAAKLLGIGKTTLYRKLKEYGVRQTSAEL